MPNYQKAVTPVEKFTRYSLDPTNPNNDGKAYSYEHGLGYTKENAEELHSRIHEAVTSGEYVPFDTRDTEHGIK